jgi:hypothetical protein
MKNMGYREMLSSRLSRMLGWNVTLIFVFTGQCLVITVSRS